MRKQYWILELGIIAIGIGCVTLYEASKYIEFSTDSYESYMKYYLLQTDYLEVIDRLPAFFAIFPLLAFMFLNGTYVYNNWSNTGIYIITRKKSRSIAFLLDSCHLALYSAIGSLIYLSVPVLYAILIIKQPFLLSKVINIKLFCSTCALCYYSSLVQNVISIRYGSSYGSIIGAIGFLCIASFSMSLLNNIDTIGVKLLSFIIPFLPFYFSPMCCVSLSTVIIYSVSNIICITVVGLIMIQSMDIGLSNKEYI